MSTENAEECIQSYSKGQKGFSNSKQIFIGFSFFSTGKKFNFKQHFYSGKMDGTLL
jgi:hypothetical protein